MGIKNKINLQCTNSPLSPPSLPSDSSNRPPKTAQESEKLGTKSSMSSTIMMMERSNMESLLMASRDTFMRRLSQSSDRSMPMDLVRSPSQSSRPLPQELGMISVLTTLT